MVFRNEQELLNPMAPKEGPKKKNVRIFRLMPSTEGSEARTLVETTAYTRKSASAAYDDDDEIIDVETVDSPASNQEDVEQRENPHVGEAAKHGIFYDDRSYDYTQHLRLIGVTPGAVYVDAKKKPSSESAAKDTAVALDELHKATYEQIQAVDLDPRVREVLEALEDDRYVGETVEDDYFKTLDEKVDVEEEEEVDLGESEDTDVMSTAMHVDQREASTEEDTDVDYKSVDFEDSKRDLYSGFESGEEDNHQPYLCDQQVASVLEGAMHDLLSFQTADADEARGEPCRDSSGLQKREARKGKRELRLEAAARGLDAIRQTMAFSKEEVLEAAARRTVGGRKIVAVEQPVDASPVQPLRSTSLVQPRLIRESSARAPQAACSGHQSTSQASTTTTARINRGAPRSRTETAEEKRARKAASKNRHLVGVATQTAPSPALSS